VDQVAVTPCAEQAMRRGACFVGLFPFAYPSKASGCPPAHTCTHASVNGDHLGITYGSFMDGLVPWMTVDLGYTPIWQQLGRANKVHLSCKAAFHGSTEVALPAPAWQKGAPVGLQRLSWAPVALYNGSAASATNVASHATADQAARGVSSCGPLSCPRP